MTFYLKYRPQTLDEITGQDVVKKALQSSFQDHKLSHAYLFAGPRGSGKTSTARILAKMVNCESQESRVKSQESRDYPCNKCSTCISITDGSNLDLIEIDAASNRGIEDIRSLREKIKLAPTSGKKKVYIIDEVHMLTTDAFNALLKTLEEPPGHALFVLATTEPGKIPSTILSRVQKLDFKMATIEQLLQVLEKISQKEKIDIDREALQILAKKAEGSFRDGVKLLDQLSSFKGKITVKSLKETLKATQFDDTKVFLQILAGRSAKDSLLHLSKQMEYGLDVKELLLSLMEVLRNLLLIKNELGDQLVKPNLTDDQYEELLKLADSFSHQDLVSDLDILQKALEQLKFAVITSLPLELAIVDICGPQEKIVKDEPKKTVEILNNSPDIAKLQEKWTFVLETIRPYNFSLEALLRSSSIFSCSDSEVVMEVPYSFHQRILEAPKNRDLLESVFSDVLGRQIRVTTILGNRPARKEDVANIEVAADDEIIRVASEIFNSDTVN
ncbi:DNA polymerase III subunit gamma/tau [Candidatus Daviesbacteria bacterium]|nr:DNA polymerase III subunit gamma/tau [Candidatus Daviesbacteria bacterium]